MKKEQPILSICIPTYNRGELLVYTLTLFKEQILRNQGKVELVVCDNASTDNTYALISEYQKKESFFDYIRYEEHLEFGGDSIIRSTERANGTFMLIYGDDDIPMPQMVDELLKIIQDNPECGYICFNRLRGNSCREGFGIENVHVAGDNTIKSEPTRYDDIRDFAEVHQNEVGFISVNMVKTELWRKRYKDVYPNNHRGYEFILPYLYSAKGYPCLYIHYPLCVQRLPKGDSGTGAQTWADKRLLYFYLGRPRAIFAQEKYGIVRNAKELFKNYESQFGDSFLYSSLMHITEVSAEVIECAEEVASYLSSEDRQLMVKRLLQSKGFKKKYYKVFYKIRRRLMRYRAKYIK